MAARIEFPITNLAEGFNVDKQRQPVFQTKNQVSYDVDTSSSAEDTDEARQEDPDYQARAPAKKKLDEKKEQVEDHITLYLRHSGKPLAANKVLRVSMLLPKSQADGEKMTGNAIKKLNLQLPHITLAYSQITVHIRVYEVDEDGDPVGEKPARYVHHPASSILVTILIYLVKNWSASPRVIDTLAEFLEDKGFGRTSSKQAAEHIYANFVLPHVSSGVHRVRRGGLVNDILQANLRGENYNLLDQDSHLVSSPMALLSVICFALNEARDTFDPANPGFADIPAIDENGRPLDATDGCLNTILKTYAPVFMVFHSGVPLTRHIIAEFYNNFAGIEKEGDAQMRRHVGQIRSLFLNTKKVIGDLQKTQQAVVMDTSAIARAKAAEVGFSSWRQGDEDVTANSRWMNTLSHNKENSSGSRGKETTSSSKANHDDSRRRPRTPPRRDEVETVVGKYSNPLMKKLLEDVKNRDFTFKELFDHIKNKYNSFNFGKPETDIPYLIDVMKTDPPL